MAGSELIRATIFHAPSPSQLICHEDGGLLITNGRVARCGDFTSLRADNQRAGLVETDWRGGFVLPGFVDTHVHYPQLNIIGALGRTLLDWLEHVALPEEARMGDTVHAIEAARNFVQALAAHGTTTALVFGAHFADATAALFEAAASKGLRVVSGLVMSDRLLRSDLLQSPEHAYRDSAALIRQYHKHGRLLYAVTPRFALSTYEGMLEVCQTLLEEYQDVRFQTHINENVQEVAELASLFPWAADYLSVYERYSLAGRRSVMAHNVHATNSEIARLAASGTSVAHCPGSNAMLGSGIFPLRRHRAAGVKCALGTDVGGGIGFGMMKEALQAYLMQRLSPDGVLLGAGDLLYLITLAGAEALGMQGEIGDFTTGKSADLVYLRPASGTVLESVLKHSEGPEHTLSALFTMADGVTINEVRVEGAPVYRSSSVS